MYFIIVYSHIPNPTRTIDSRKNKMANKPMHDVFSVLSLLTIQSSFLTGYHI